jgi:phosphatidylserine/phosphatidylglycerophosphate/cardiolipin synthase-like enzyme
MALVEAYRRGISVRVILDKSNVKETYSSATFLRNMGIPPLIDSEHAIAHNKVLVVDGREVITGSFNFSKAAEQKNAENLVFIDDPAVAAAYTRNWQDHASHSLPMGAVGRVNRSPATTAPLAAEEDEQSKPSVVGNRRSKIYEWQGCPAYSAISPRNRVEFPSKQAAEAAGYRAARNCP